VRLAALLERFPRISGAALAVIAALPALVAFRGFTVDDALISARVASNLAAGAGYRFNPGGPEVDAVTPLGWAHLLALFGPGSPVTMLERGRVIGAVGWLGAAATLGVLLSRSTPFGRLGGLLLLAFSSTAAAWATSGMETGLVTLFAALALVPQASGAFAGGVAAALRPELLPYSCVLAVGGVFFTPTEPRRRAALVARAVLLASGPALAVALVRTLWFGTPAPLALSAKPPDLEPGLPYALAAALVTSPLLLLVAPLALRRAGPAVARVVLSLAAHFVAIALAGGDWMPLFRLAVPALPAALLAGAEIAKAASPRWHGARLALAAVVSIAYAVFGSWPMRGVLATRLEFIDELRARLHGARVTATVDAGLVGAATDGAVFDLAGVTDATVARLPGGHTKKRVSEGLVQSRDVDHAVLLLAPGTRRAEPWQSSRFFRVADAGIAQMPFVQESFELVGELPLRRTAYRYIVLKRVTPKTPR
jgi:hypothetical protein